MPGILPMKVIKVGSSSQSRIAQACDRCRSKKIRCDGIRPTCSQCSTVGFECRTSDKLSRRAFPRGYTESLEERVRILESEVRDLKDLLDEKDETIDMLSKIHGNSRRLSVGSASIASVDVKEIVVPKEDTFRVQASPLLLGVENSDSYFMGASSGRAFIEAFKRKMQEVGKPCSDFNTEAFLHIQGCYPLVATNPALVTMRVPPRLFSDRCVNVFFQEWAPLFPVLHRPSFLRQYEEFVVDPEKIKSPHKLAQLYLVFAMAALSSDKPDLEQIAVCEQQWQQALESVTMQNTMATLQCLVLALIYCTIRADYKRLQHYKAVAVGLSHRLGLHQSQKRFSFGALTTETRKKVFWTLYTLDCFSAAMLGLPKLLKDDDVHAEYPADVDDEYVTEKGFQPTLPGEYTRLSSALALFRGSRILAKVLEKNYPAATSYELSLQQMSTLETELDEWSDSLPQHLKLTFKQDKPSTNVTGSRSPILSLAYYYTKTLIHRPAVGSNLGSKAAPSLHSIAESSKRMIQIVELLEERRMSFTFCVNKCDVLMLCGMTLLYQTLDLKRDSKLVKDIEKFTNSVIRTAEQAKAPGIYDLKKVAGALIAVEDVATNSLPTPPQHSPEAAPATALPRDMPQAQISRKKSGGSIGRHMGASVSETDLLLQQEKLRRMALPTTTSNGGTDIPVLYRSNSRSSFDNARADLATFKREHQAQLHHSHPQMSHASMIARVSPSIQRTTTNSLDYLSFSHTAAATATSHHNHGQLPSPTTSSRPGDHDIPPNNQLDDLYVCAARASLDSNDSSAWETVLGQFDQPPHHHHHQQQQQQQQQHHVTSNGGNTSHANITTTSAEHLHFYDGGLYTNANSHPSATTAAAAAAAANQQLALETSVSVSSSYSDWSPNPLEMPAFSMDEFSHHPHHQHQQQHHHHHNNNSNNNNNQNQHQHHDLHHHVLSNSNHNNHGDSALSLSEASPSSACGGDDLAGSLHGNGSDLSVSVGELDYTTGHITTHEQGGSGSGGGGGGVNGTMLSPVGADGFGLDGLDNGFGL